jgi:2-aminoethylphosphonate-pyruvate transaminase
VDFDVGVGVHMSSSYTRLSEAGFVIYPGKLTHEDCFRIGTIGRITEKDIRALVEAIREVLAKMNVTLS